MHSFLRIFTSQRAHWECRIFTKRKCSNAVFPMSEFVERGNLIFTQEQKRQIEKVGRVEKIAVGVSGPPEDIVLMMNQDISTPYDCCKHISLPLCNQSPLALVNDSILWDMHRPLPGECRLKFLSFRDKDPFSLNEVFWRTGSLVLGAVIMNAFKKEAGVNLLSFPEVMVSSGSFIYDVKMKLNNWQPTSDELKILSGEFFSFVQKNHRIERLDVKKSIAIEIFEGNEMKLNDVREMAAKSEDHLVTLYRVGDHIDVSSGPMIGDTSFFGRCSVASIHPLMKYLNYPLYRFQGIALPKGILLNSYAYRVILQRAQNLNEIYIPGLEEEFQPCGNPGILPKNSETKINFNF